MCDIQQVTPEIQTQSAWTRSWSLILFPYPSNFGAHLIPRVSRSLTNPHGYHCYRPLHCWSISASLSVPGLPSQSVIPLSTSLPSWAGMVSIEKEWGTEWQGGEGGQERSMGDKALKEPGRAEWEESRAVPLCGHCSDDRSHETGAQRTCLGWCERAALLSPIWDTVNLKCLQNLQVRLFRDNLTWEPTV